MFKILKKEVLSPDIFLMEIEAPRIAHSANPGEFIIVIPDEKGERIPLTIVDYDKETGSVTIVFQVVGMSSQKMAQFEVGDSFMDFTGPLGCPSDFIHWSDDRFKREKLLFVAGGVGVAPILPQLKWLHLEKGVKADLIVGAKSALNLVLLKELSQHANQLLICTDDGSFGEKGLVTNILERLLQSDSGYSRVITIGPMIMMKYVAMMTQKFNIPTIASLNSLMVDGTGMCGACRVTVGGQTKFTCVDGPEFDAHLINFDEAMRRQNMYKTIEGRKAIEFAELLEGHICHIGGVSHE